MRPPHSHHGNRHTNYSYSLTTTTSTTTTTRCVPDSSGFAVHCVVGRSSGIAGRLVPIMASFLVMALPQVRYLLHNHSTTLDSESQQPSTTTNVKRRVNQRSKQYLCRAVHASMLSDCKPIQYNTNSALQFISCHHLHNTHQAHPFHMYSASPISPYVPSIASASSTTPTTPPSSATPTTPTGSSSGNHNGSLQPPSASMHILSPNSVGNSNKQFRYPLLGKV
jgi:hypothetical protein